MIFTECGEDMPPLNSTVAIDLRTRGRMLKDRDIIVFFLIDCIGKLHAD
jgi:hypothetical protein